MPELVAHQVPAPANDDGQGLICDFLLRSDLEEDGCEVLAFTTTQSQLAKWKAEFKAAKCRLIGVTFGGLGAVRLLQQVTQAPALTSLVVTTTDQDSDLAVVQQGRPTLFRTIPRAAGGERAPPA